MTAPNSESTMLLANKEAVMTVLDTLYFVAFNPSQPTRASISE